MGAGAVREVARRHGIRPTKSLGQNFLIDPNLARAIAAEAGVGPGDRVVEVGAGLGSLTMALAATGAEVLAIEFDRALIPALTEVVGSAENVRILHADATKLDWASTLGDAGAWTLCANLPYNVAVPVVMEVLASAPAVQRLVVMVQREVGERLAATPGDQHYGAVSVKVAYRARASDHPPGAVHGVLAEAVGGLGGGAARPVVRPRRSTWMPRPCGGWSTARSPSDARRCATRCAASTCRPRRPTRS